MSDFPMIDLVKTGENILKLRKQKNLSVKELQIIFGVKIEEILVISEDMKMKSAKTLDFTEVLAQT